MCDAAILAQLADGRPIVELAHARQRTSGEVGVLRRAGAITVICAHRTDLERLPEAIGALTALERLDELPDALLDLPLTKLDLRWNPLRGRPAWLGELARRGCRVYA